MKEEKLKSLNYQMITTALFIVSLVISILLTYDKKQELLEKNRIFSKSFDKYLNLFNRIFALTIIVCILFINYHDYVLEKQKRSDTAPFRHQIYASVFNIISAVIVLYVVLEDWEEKPNFANIENPTI